MAKPLTSHPVAALFPDLNPADFIALREDIRRHGVKVPILLHGGQILDGRQRYRACQELGIKCRYVEWNGNDPWLEVQSRNLLRRQLSKEQVYAIRKLATQQFPEIAAPFEEERALARARKAQAKGRPRGEKAALIGSRDRHRESADAIGAHVGVSGSTVKRVDRLAREAPHLLPRVAAGELSVKRALREIPPRDQGPRDRIVPVAAPRAFAVDRASTRLEQSIREECLKWPRDQRVELLRQLQKQIQGWLSEEIGPGPRDSRVRAALDMSGSPGLSELHVGDHAEFGSRVVAAGAFSPHRY